MDDSGLQSSAVKYAELGWQVFPLQVKSKVPRKGWNEWQKKTSDDPEIISDLWDKLPNSNIAVRMGPESGIIDIETDSARGEAWLVKLFGGAENVPITPLFTSSSKSGTLGKHRLFKFTTRLPRCDEGHWRPKTQDGILQELDFKVGGGGLGTYCLFPPSIHPDTGETYEWLVPPDDCDPCELPEEFILNLMTEMYGEGMSGPPAHESKPAEFWDDIAKGVPEGDRNNKAAQFIGYALGQLNDPFNNTAVGVQYELMMAWNNTNRPPMDEKELKQTFDSILRRHRDTWTNEQTKKGISQFADRDPDTGKASEAPWRLVKVLSEPIRWKLFSPLWKNKAPGGFIWLTTNELRSTGAIGICALEQAGVWLDTKYFPGWWNGTKKGDEDQQKGLAYKLVENCSVEEASAEEKRSYVIAEMIHSQLLKVPEAQEDAAPDARGRFTRLSDGTIWFKVANLLEKLQHIADPVKMGELTSLLKLIHVEDRQYRVNGKTPNRFKVFTLDAQTMIEKMSLFSPHEMQEHLTSESGNKCSADGRFIAPSNGEGATEKDYTLKGFT